MRGVIPHCKYGSNAAYAMENVFSSAGMIRIRFTGMISAMLDRHPEDFLFTLRFGYHYTTVFPFVKP